MSAFGKIQNYGLTISRDDRHEYRLQLELDKTPAPVPGVTKILRAYLNFAGAPRDVLEAALLRGTAVHKAIELDACGRLDISTVDDVVGPYFQQWRNFWHASGFKPLLAEFMVASPRYGYAGELDLAGRLRGTPADFIDLVDVKTGATIPPTVGLQTAGYGQALCETMTAADSAAAKIRIRRHCLHLTKHSYRLVALHGADDLPIFLSALNLWRWTSANCKF